MTPEERLRRAIAARAQSVEPSDDGFDRITEKLLDPGGDMKAPLTSTTTRWYLVAAAAVFLAGIAGVITLVDGGDRDGTGDDISDQPTTIDAPTTTAEPDPTTTTATPNRPSEDVLQQAVWPRSSSTVRFDDPVDAARSWARYYAGFTDAVVGEFGQGDNRSGEVPIRPTANGPVTTVGLRQLDDGYWYVTSSSSENIQLTEPLPPAELTCPQVLRGAALAFEGTVQVHIDAYQPDGKRVEVGRGIVTGSGSPPAGPFDDTVACTIPTGVEDYGILHLLTVSEADENGSTWESTSFPIRLR